MDTGPARDSPFRVGDRARINSGQFEDYEVEVAEIDTQGRTIRVTMIFFDRPVQLSFSFEEAADLLERLPVIRD